MLSRGYFREIETSFECIRDRDYEDFFVLDGLQ
jgi:hypothetical protein